MDGLPSVPCEPLRIVRDGLRYGVAAQGMVAWLPAQLWAPAAALLRRMDEMNATAERFQRMLDDAQAEADAAGGVQTPYGVGFDA